MSKWIDFILLDTPHLKTQIFEVRSKENNFLLGKISWYGAWRSYAFFSEGNCVFEPTCLIDVSNFIKNLTIQRKAEKQSGVQRSL